MKSPAHREGTTHRLFQAGLFVPAVLLLEVNQPADTFTRENYFCACLNICARPAPRVGARLLLGSRERLPPNQSPLPSPCASRAEPRHVTGPLCHQPAGDTSSTSGEGTAQGRAVPGAAGLCEEPQGLACPGRWGWRPPSPPSAFADSGLAPCLAVGSGRREVRQRTLLT